MQRPLLSLFACVGLTGCTGISIAPSCPNELAVGESAPLLANEINPGEIPSYFWEVIPATVARVQDPAAAATRLEALTEGEATVRLTASDGLFQVISSCTTRVAGVADNSNDNDDNTNGNDNDDNTNGNDNSNTNDNVDGNDNVDDGKGNENDNGGRPGRGKRVKP